MNDQVITGQSNAKCRCGGAVGLVPSSGMFQCQACKGQAKKLSELTGQAGYAGAQLIKAIQQSRRSSITSNVVHLGPMAFETLSLYCAEVYPGKALQQVVGVTPVVDDTLSDESIMLSSDPRKPGYIEQQASDRFPDEVSITENGQELEDQEPVRELRRPPPQRVQMPSLITPPRPVYQPQIIESPRAPSEGQRTFKVTLVVNAASEEQVKAQMQALKTLMGISDIDVAPLLVEER